METRQPNVSTAIFSFSLACAPVKRVNKSRDYSARDYKVFLLEGLSLPTWETRVDQEPSKVVLDNLRQTVGLYGTTAHPLTVSTSQCDLTLFYAVPVSCEDVPSQAGQYHTISRLLDISEQFHLDYRTRSMITALDLWLRERHTLPIVNVDTVFLCSKEGEGVGGLVKAVIENPVHSSRLRPPEDNLVISLNNPVFEKTTTQDTTITSNA